MDSSLVFPREPFRDTVYLKSVVKDPNIEVGEFSMYNDWVNHPADFEKNCVLYHYPVNPEKLIIGKFCSIACGARFMFTSGNHASASLSNYPFPIFFREWGLEGKDICSAWDNKGDIVIGNDVWIGYEAIIMQGVKIGDGAVIGARSVVTRDVEPFSIVAGSPARKIRYRFGEETISRLLKLEWWNWPEESIRKHIDDLREGRLDALELETD